MTRDKWIEFLNNPLDYNQILMLYCTTKGKDPKMTGTFYHALKVLGVLEDFTEEAISIICKEYSIIALIKNGNIIKYY